jgi:hypothetical protein
MGDRSSRWGRAERAEGERESEGQALKVQNMACLGLAGQVTRVSQKSCAAGQGGGRWLPEARRAVESETRQFWWMERADDGVSTRVL